jgi:CheY-like chemotaxis protein
VEDDPDSLELVAVALQSAGAKVTCCSRASEALETRGDFDVIVSDIGMPEVDGYAFMRRVRGRNEGGDVPALALTAYAGSEDAARAMRAGFQEHLAKPIDAGALVDAVARWARMRASTRSAKRVAASP